MLFWKDHTGYQYEIVGAVVGNGYAMGGYDEVGDYALIDGVIFSSDTSFTSAAALSVARDRKSVV